MPTKNKYFLIIFAVCLLAFDAYYYFFYSTVTLVAYKSGDIQKVSTAYETFLPKINLFIDNKQFLVEVAQTVAEKSLGLGNRDGLNQNGGMLFVFKKTSKQYFWMKDMKFPIDIVWIDETKKIVGFVEGAMPEDYPEAYPSPSNVLYVLEIRSGEVKNQGIKIGDLAIFDVFPVQ